MRLPDFVGREGWLATLRQILARDDRIGLVAVQGLPGVGKTQLAKAIAKSVDLPIVLWPTWRSRWEEPTEPGKRLTETTRSCSMSSGGISASGAGC